MQRSDPKAILLWCLLLAGSGGSALWASARPGWVQDRIFGPAPTIPPENDGHARLWIASIFDSPEGGHIVDRCREHSYFVAYRIEGVFLHDGGTVIVEGDRLSVHHFGPPAGAATSGAPSPTEPRKLGADELFAIWSAVESARSDAPPAGHIVAVLDGATYFFAACTGGQLWTATESAFDTAEPPSWSRASKLMYRYLDRSAPTR